MEAKHAVLLAHAEVARNHNLQPGERLDKKQVQKVMLEFDGAYHFSFQGHPKDVLWRFVQRHIGARQLCSDDIQYTVLGVLRSCKSSATSFSASVRVPSWSDEPVHGPERPSKKAATHAAAELFLSSPQVRDRAKRFHPPAKWFGSPREGCRRRQLLRFWPWHCGTCQEAGRQLQSWQHVKGPNGVLLAATFLDLQAGGGCSQHETAY